MIIEIFNVFDGGECKLKNCYKLIVNNYWVNLKKGENNYWNNQVGLININYD